MPFARFASLEALRTLRALVKLLYVRKKQTLVVHENQIIDVNDSVLRNIRNIQYSKCVNVGQTA